MAHRIRWLGVAAGAVLGLWWGRLIAHSKTPPPEGRWREVKPEELD